MGTNATRPIVRSLAVAAGALVMVAACSSGGGTTGPTTTTVSTAFSTIPIATTATPDTAPGQGSGNTGSTVAGGGATYTVQPNDFFVGIAKKLGVPLQALLDANGMQANSLITPGQKLKVPAATTNSTTASTSTGSTAATTSTTIAQDGSGVYVVQANDYWAGIAQKLGIKADALAAFNDMTLSTVIHPGQKLRVPPKSTTTTKG